MKRVGFDTAPFMRTWRPVGARDLRAYWRLSGFGVPSATIVRMDNTEEDTSTRSARWTWRSRSPASGSRAFVANSR
ncbi:hypothetical protein NKH77_24680 [Streptomyces sp. M19]